MLCPAQMFYTKKIARTEFFRNLDASINLPFLFVSFGDTWGELKGQLNAVDLTAHFALDILDGLHSLVL